MAGLAAIALHNARLSRAAEERNRQLSALIDASRAMTSTLDLDELLEVVCRQAALALDAGSSYIYEYDAEADAMVWLAEHQRDVSHCFEEPLGTVYPIDDLPQDLAVVRTRQPVEVRLDDPDLDDVMRRQLLEWEEQSSLMVPLVVGGEVVGSLEVSEAVYPRHFTEQEIALCVALGEQAAVAIHNAQLYRQVREQKETIERQATIDGLTGLFNHRYFWDRLRDEVARACRYDQPLSLLMLDLDDFKLVNDRFGHPVGDELLRAVGRALQTQIRQGVDCAARYGGEEFAVILPCHRVRARGRRARRRRHHGRAHPQRHRRPARAGRRPRLAGDHGEHRRRHAADPRRRRRGPRGEGGPRALRGEEPRQGQRPDRRPLSRQGLSPRQ